MRVECPSSPPEIATNVLGVFAADGFVRYLPFRVVPLHSADQNSAVRYTTTCVGASCRHWVGASCEWPKIVIDSLGSTAGSLQQVHCNIFSNCRWRLQTNGEACAPCARVHGAMTLKTEGDSL